MPLPHELRPPDVLSRTMDYLMCNVVDRGEHMAGTMADLFHFVEQLQLEATSPADPYTRFYVRKKVYSPPPLSHLLLLLLLTSSSPPGDR